MINKLNYNQTTSSSSPYFISCSTGGLVMLSLPEQRSFVFSCTYSRRRNLLTNEWNQHSTLNGANYLVQVICLSLDLTSWPPSTYHSFNHQRAPQFYEWKNNIDRFCSSSWPVTERRQSNHLKLIWHNLQTMQPTHSLPGDGNFQVFLLE